MEGTPVLAEIRPGRGPQLSRGQLLGLLAAALVPAGARAEPAPAAAARPLLAGFFHMGYLTADMDAAQALFRVKFGIAKFQTLGTGAATPERPYPVRFALAWVGATMVELIQPIGAPSPVYAPGMPEPGAVSRLHHLGYRMTRAAEWAATLQALADQQIPIVQKGAAGDNLEFLYADARKELGHHLEFVWTKEGRPDFYAGVPQN